MRWHTIYHNLPPLLSAWKKKKKKKIGTDDLSIRNLPKAVGRRCPRCHSLGVEDADDADDVDDDATGGRAEGRTVKNGKSRT